jgi:hypothetical protein
MVNETGKFRSIDDVWTQVLAFIERVLQPPNGQAVHVDAPGAAAPCLTNSTLACLRLSVQGGAPSCRLMGKDQVSPL